MFGQVFEHFYYEEIILIKHIRISRVVQPLIVAPRFSLVIILRNSQFTTTPGNKIRGRLKEKLQQDNSGGIGAVRILSEKQVAGAREKINATLLTFLVLHFSPLPLSP